MTKTKKTERGQLVKEVAQLTALVKTQAAALEIAQAQFKSYSIHHMRKGTEESRKKAVVNDQLAAAMGLALAGSMNWPTRYQETRAWEALKALANWPGVPDELKTLAAHAVAEIGQGREPTVTTEATALGGSACPSQLVREYLEERGEFSALSTWHLYDLAAYAVAKFRERMRAARPANGLHSGGYVRDVPQGGVIALQPPEAILSREAALARGHGKSEMVRAVLEAKAQGFPLAPVKVTLKSLDGGKAKN